MSFTGPLPGSGGFFPMKPMWHPPISASWILTIIVLIAASNVSALPPNILKVFSHPAGFFITFLFALSICNTDFYPGCFALLFFLLMVWAHQRRIEGYCPAGTIDWVTNSKRWFVEVVLKEKPLAIQDRNVNTYPVQS